MSDRAAACLLVAALACGTGAFASGFETLETDDLRLLYTGGTQSFLAPHAARCFENALGFHRRLWGYDEHEKITVLLADFSDRGNAGAVSVPHNLLLLQTAPLGFDYETIAANERMNWLMNHELVHIVAVDQAAGQDRLFRKLFRGKVLAVPEHPETILYFYLTAPRDAAPRWYHEGIAVFVETWMAGGIGRAQGAYDEMVFRSMVADDSHFYDPLGLVSEGTRIDFQVEVNSYLYGTRFMSWLALEYGPESLIRWVGRTPGSRKYYAAQFREVYGRSLSEAWREWVEWEHGFQQENLERVRRFPVTPFEDLSDRALGSVSRAHYDASTETIYGAFNYPGAVSHVGAISARDGSVTKLTEIKGPAIYAVTSLAFDPDEKVLFYTTDNVEHRDLVRLDPETRKTRLLLKDVRIGDLDFDATDRSLWGIRHFNAITTLVRIPHPYDQWIQVQSWPYGEVIHDLDVSPDGTLIALSVAQISGRHTLQVLRVDDLEQGRVEPIAELDFGTALPSNFTFSPAGRYLYGSSYYTGVSNIFRYDFAEDSWEAMTNTDTGFFRPIPLEDGSLIVFRYSGEGFVPARIRIDPLEDVNPIVFLGQQVVERHPVVEEWVVGSPARVDLEERTTREGAYPSWGLVGVESLYPIVEGYKDDPAYGARLNLSDPLGLNKFHLNASYTPNDRVPSDERYHVELGYRRYDFRVDAKLNDADFYDLFGPTKTSRRGYSVSVGWNRNLIWDLPRQLNLSLFGAYYGDIDRLPSYQNVDVATDHLLYASARLGFSNVRGSLGAVAGEKGHSWALALGGSQAADDPIPSLTGNYDVGFELPLPHSSIWIRNSAGFAVGDRVDPFANFFFGGFGNNYVDFRRVQRYRSSFAFPGVGLNEIAGRNYVKSILEWNLPPIRLRRVGSPGFYGSWIRPALFASGISTNVDDDRLRRDVADAGIQFDLRLTAVSRLDLTVSFGAALAFEKDRATRDEFMFSVKLLH